MFTRTILRSLPFSNYFNQFLFILRGLQSYSM
uniref:Uncharacterized protein n=1 Tax=Rhizophora mucronata TaxID=61149 RepID=A0A2P2IXY2_RHIMU